MSGKQEELLQELKNRMEYHAERHEFERAARFRDSYFDMQKMMERQKVVSDNTKINWDIVGFARNSADIGVVVLKIRSGRLTEKKEFDFALNELDDSPDILRRFLSEFYTRNPDVPSEILLPFELDDVAVIKDWLGLKVSVPKAQKKFELLELANKNAALFLEKVRAQKSAKLQTDWNEIGTQIAEKLNLHKFPRRVECFDISHIQGTNTVASMVVFENGRPKKSDYKRFKIKTLPEGKPDDFESMREVVKRRYSRKDWVLPDLIIIDGGKGQLSSAVSVLEELGLQEQDVVSLAKKLEEVFVPRQSAPIIFDMTSTALFFFQKIRDEAHRFAINYHRKLRENQATESILDEVKGLSQKRKKLLFEKFGDIKTISKATKEVLQEVLGEKTGARVYSFLNFKR